MGPRHWQVYVNTRPVLPLYESERAAIKRAKAEAKTHRIVTVSLHVGNLRPRVVATWTDGERN